MLWSPPSRGTDGQDLRLTSEFFPYAITITALTLLWLGGLGGGTVMLYSEHQRAWREDLPATVDTLAKRLHCSTPTDKDTITMPPFFFCRGKQMDTLSLASTLAPASLHALLPLGVPGEEGVQPWLWTL